MKILALDTSSLAASCAVWENGKLAGEFFANVRLTHSQTALPMLDALLKQTRKTIEEIDLFAVTVGPGSFTGLRIGMAAIKGMAFALGKPCVGISTLECLAQNLVAFPGTIVPVMDARCEQVYTTTFLSDGLRLERKAPDEAISISELRERLASLSPQPIYLVGDGAGLVKQAMPELSHVRVCPETLQHQRASSLCVLAQEKDTVSPDGLVPQYLRVPQAERELQRKQNIVK